MNPRVGSPEEIRNENNASPPPRRSLNQTVTTVLFAWLLTAIVVTPAAGQQTPAVRCDGTDNTSSSFIDCDDRDALIAIYNGLVTPASVWDDTTSPNNVRQPFNSIGKSTSNWIRFDETTGRVVEIKHLSKYGGTGRPYLEQVLPAEIGLLTELTSLTIGSQYGLYSGPLPVEIGLLTKLTSLTASSSFAELIGPIPAEIGDLSSLEVLKLTNGRLTGPIPPEIGQLTNLEELDLRYNKLTGPIPAEIGNLTGLTKLELRDNYMSGPLPPEIGNLTGLGELDLSFMGLTGPIPPEIGNLTGLGELDLSYNRLTGQVPPELGQLTNLKNTWAALNLSYNQLSGALPVELAEILTRPTLARGTGNLVSVYGNEIRRASYTLEVRSRWNHKTDAFEERLERVYGEVKRLCRPRELGNIVTGTSVYCQITDYSEPAPRKPNKPLRPSLPVLAPGDQQLTVSWGEAYNGGSPITAYDVQYKLKTATAWTTVTRTNPTATTQPISGLTNNTAYQVRVRATNAQGNSPWSDTAEAKPSDVTVTAYQMDAPLLTPASQRITLSWSTPAGITPTGYEIRYRQAGTPTWTSHPHTGTGTSNTITNNITNNTTYQIQLRTTTASTTTPWSATAVGVFGASTTLCTDTNGIPIACVQSAGCT